MRVIVYYIGTKGSNPPVYAFTVYAAGRGLKCDSRNSAYDGEGEGKRRLVTVVHRVNYTIFAAGRVVFRGSEWFGG